MRYRVTPGLYAVGVPDDRSPVLVSANYKLSFDALRRELAGIAAWILVVDTDGVNVWCAAGKGTFSSERVVQAVRDSRLAEIVTRKRLVVPQLAGPGICAQKVKDETGFYVRFGPVRARDLPAFLAANLVATDDMRLVRFSLRDRLVLVPVEIAHASLKFLPVIAAFFVIGGVHRHGFDLDQAWSRGWPPTLAALGAVVAGLGVTPALLPWLPGRPFSIKGALVGVAWWVCYLAVRSAVGIALDAVWAGIYGLLLVAASSFLAMNYTGCTPFTSLSGVKLEMRFAVPAQAVTAIAGLALLGAAELSWIA